MHRVPVSAIAAFLVAVALAAAALLVGTGNFVSPAARSANQIDKANAELFGLSEASSPSQTVPDERFKGAVFLDAGDRSPWFGTYVGGDSYTGTVRSTSFPLAEPKIHIPVIGYPDSNGNSLALEILGPDGTVIDSIVCQSGNSMEKIELWTVSVKAWVGHRARLKLTDGLTGMRGWLGVGHPLGVSRWLANVPTNYTRLVIAILAIAGLLFIPGAALRTWSPRFSRSIALLPVPGLLMLAVLGPLVATGVLPGSTRLFSIAVLLGSALTSAGLGLLWWRRGSPFVAADRSPFLIYACVCGSSLAYACLPLSVPQRVSPPWSPLMEITSAQRETLLPFLTASHLLNRGKVPPQGTDPVDGIRAPEYRAPFVPLCIVSLLTIFRVDPVLPTTASVGAWPLDPGGYFLGRIFGILTQAFVLLGGVCLAARMLPQAWRRALTWLAVAPVVLLGTDFPAPLLLAAFFCTLAVISILGSRSAPLAGIGCSLAVVTHPTACLMILPVAGLLLHDAATCHDGKCGARLGIAIRQGLLFFAVLLPVLALWIHFSTRGNALDLTLRTIAGDGHELARASDPGSWLMARVSNLWYTLMPTALFFIPPPEIAADSLLSASLRWVDGYAGSLAGHVGYFAFLFCATLAAEPGRDFRRRVWGWLIWGALGLMLAVWGTSSGGLGRHGLETLSILLIVVASSTSGLGDRAWKWLMIATTAEAVSLRAIGIFSSASLGSSAISPQTVILSLIVITGTILPLVWYLRTDPGHVSPAIKHPPPSTVAS
ncbi:MAG: hypothetical protein KBA71_04605 [Opitutaceae bacterium]|nr:hypothetical protein [Opitutaceae bacterium]